MFCQLHRLHLSQGRKLMSSCLQFIYILKSMQFFLINLASSPCIQINYINVDITYAYENPSCINVICYIYCKTKLIGVVLTFHLFIEVSDFFIVIY